MNFTVHMCVKSTENQGSLYQLRFCSIHFIVILAGLKKIICYTEDFLT